MTTLADIRQKYPQYGDMSDGQLADALHEKFYSDMPRPEFDAKIGFDPLADEARQNLTAMKGDLRPARPGDEISRDTVLPFRETMGPDGKPVREFAVPGLIMEPVRAAERLFTRGTAPGAVPMHQAPREIGEQFIGDVMAAGSAAIPATRVPSVTTATGPLLNRLATADEAFGPRISGPAHLDAALGRDAPPAPVATRPVLGGSPRDELLAAAERQGIELPAALASDSHLVRGTAGVIKESPLGGTPIVNAMRQALDQIEQRRQQQIDRLGGASAAGAGQTARDQIADWINNRSRAEAESIYAMVDVVADLSTPVPLQALRDTLSAIEARARGMRQETPAIVQRFRAAADDPVGLDYDRIKDLRTQVGLMREGQKIGPQAGIDDAALGQIYGALTDDMARSIREAGKQMARENMRDPAQRRALRDIRGISRVTKTVEDSHIENTARMADDWRIAADERFESEIASKRDALRKIVGKEGDATPEAIVQRVRNYASARGSADIGRLQSVMGVLDESGKNEMRAAILAQIGETKDGFSPAVFRTEMGKFSPAGRQLLFGPELTQVLDDIGTISQRFEQVAKLGNPSGTGRVVAFGGLGTAAGASVAAGTAIPILAAAAGIVGTYALARMLARPATARAVKDFAERYSQASLTRNEAAMQAATAALREAGRAIPQQALGEDRRP